MERNVNWSINYKKTFIMNRLSYLFLPLTAIGVSACSSNKAKEEVKRPNIIFMMTDDHTTQAMSCYGGRLLQTPNMDRIANEGIRMDNCYAVNACLLYTSPSPRD